MAEAFYLQLEFFCLQLSFFAYSPYRGNAWKKGGGSQPGAERLQSRAGPRAALPLYSARPKPSEALLCPQHGGNEALAPAHSRVAPLIRGLLLGFHQRKTKGQQLKGKIGSALFRTFWQYSTHFHTFSEFFRIFPPGL